MAKSKIELLLDELEDYIEGCKYQMMSGTKIIVEKACVSEYISELKKTTPEELAKYQKVVSNRDAILKDAREKADALINEAAQQTSEMVNQNSIMKQAYAQADEVVKSAYIQAQEILTTATLEANELRSSAVEYLDNELAQYESIVASTLNLTHQHYEHFYSQLSEYYNAVVNNRMQLNPPSMDTVEVPADYVQAELGNTGAMENTEAANNNIQNTGSISGASNQVKDSAQNTGDLKLM